MGKQSSALITMPKKRWPLMILLLLSLSTAMVFLIRSTSKICNVTINTRTTSTTETSDTATHFSGEQDQTTNPLNFMKSKLVLLVSHELSLSGGPLLLMELAFLLRGVGAEVVWITNQKPSERDVVIYSLEHKMLDRGVQVLSAKGKKAIDTALKADLVVLNTAVAGKWLDAVLKEKVSQVLPKVLWWIHEMRGHYFNLEYVKHLPFVAGAMIDSHTTAEYWKNRTRERLGIRMPETYVVHLGNSKDLMEVAQDSIAKRVLREHVRESLGVRDEDLLFAIINSVSRGKGQDLFLRSFYQSLQLIQEKKLQVPSMHAVVVGSDMNAQTKFETELRSFVIEKKIQNRVHFVNKTLTVAPYLASIDVLVQNSQARGECFGRITIEAMAFQLPILGTAAGGTMEIVVNGTTGFLHPADKEGVTPLANNIVKLATHVEKRLTMGKKGYERVKERFLEHHMSQRIAFVLKEVLQYAKTHSPYRNSERRKKQPQDLFDLTMSGEGEDAVRRRTAVTEYRKKLLQHKEIESRVRSVRENLRTAKKEFNKTEDDLKSLQSVGQIIGEVLRPLDNERLIVKASSGPRYVVGCRSKVDKEKLTSGTRVVLDMTTLTIMRALPREVDPVVYNMLHEDPGNVSYSAVGGLSDQIRELRESIELPLMNPELFLRVGIKPPKGVLLYGPPGTGKTLLARAIASNIDANFLKVVSSAIIDKYIGESARLIREMFGYARDHQPCIIFMDEIDAIGGRRFSEGTSADREIQRTLMELLNQLDGFDQLGKVSTEGMCKKSYSSFPSICILRPMWDILHVKMIMATNRPDVLDPALLRPGRLDRKIEIPLPNEQSRMEILKIHAAGIAKHGEIDYEAVVKLAEGFNGADLRNVCTEAGMSAIRAERDYVIHEDFMKAVRKLNEAKKLESSAHYNTDFGKE
ncbi:hypothetical protein Patl1_09206 [Pistacia atlantica]|uniref:Uncharacterized protein n=1 Tax=Pistacia atlantica TaxID=434234 RepID=A0ACC1AD13_9ROSI|nr:hypothetical protein Patl1_09206 [Pistacia atlantica]